MEMRCAIVPHETELTKALLKKKEKRKERKKKQKKRKKQPSACSVTSRIQLHSTFYEKTKQGQTDCLMRHSLDSLSYIIINSSACVF